VNLPHTVSPVITYKKQLKKAAMLPFNLLG